MNIHVIRKDGQLVADYVHIGTVAAVLSRDSLNLEPAEEMYGAAFFQAVKVTDVLALECGYVVPLGFDYRCALLVLVGAVGHDGEPGHKPVVDALETRVADDAEQLNPVDLFHTVFHYLSLYAGIPARHAFGPFAKYGIVFRSAKKNALQGSDFYDSLQLTMLCKRMSLQFFRHKAIFLHKNRKNVIFSFFALLDMPFPFPIFGTMYKISSDGEDRHCLECGEPLYGRPDKKFCSTSCKSKYHGEMRRWHNMLYATTLENLNRNYAILEHMYTLHSTGCQLKELSEMGFMPDFVTHKVEKKGKHLEYRCFDFIYNMSASKLFNLRRL